LIKRWAFPSKRRDRRMFKAKNSYLRCGMEHWVLLIVIASGSDLSHMEKSGTDEAKKSSCEDLS